MYLRHTQWYCALCQHEIGSNNKGIIFLQNRHNTAYNAMSSKIRVFTDLKNFNSYILNNTITRFSSYFFVS
jgi:hypothetical protein